jgi:hypothetical protein
VARKPYQLPAGVRFLTEAELSERRAAKAGKKLERVERKVAADGWSLGELAGGVKRRAAKSRRRHRRIPRGIWRR